MGLLSFVVLGLVGFDRQVCCRRVKNHFIDVVNVPNGPEEFPAAGSARRAGVNMSILQDSKHNVWLETLVHGILNILQAGITFHCRLLSFWFVYCLSTLSHVISHVKIIRGSKKYG